MLSSVLLLALCGLATASPVGARPKPQEGCTKLLPNSGAPVPGDGSPAAYMNSTNCLWQAAASAPTPAGYTQAFSSRGGAIFDPQGYLTYTVLQTGKYDTDACAAFCNRVAGCAAFNIYAERDPKYELGATCKNPAPATNIACALYSQAISANTTSNSRQWAGNDRAREFESVVVASNGYTLALPAVPGYTLLSALNASAITAPPADNAYMGYSMHASPSSYEPGKCAADCTAKTAFNAAHGIGMACAFFNSYVLVRNGSPEGTACAFYTRAYDAGYATNRGYGGGGEEVAIAQSYTFAVGG